MGRSRSDAMGRAAKKDHPERVRAAPPSTTSDRRERATRGPRARPTGRSRSDAWGWPAFRSLRGPFRGGGGGFRDTRRVADSEAQPSDTGVGGTRTTLAAGFIGSGPKPSVARSSTEETRAGKPQARSGARTGAAEAERLAGAPTGGGETRWRTLVYQGFGSGPPSSGTCLHDRRQCTALASWRPRMGLLMKNRSGPDSGPRIRSRLFSTSRRP